MRAIVSVIGKDKKGIIARVSDLLFRKGVNIEDISQTIMQEYFTMIMMVDMGDSCAIGELRAELKSLGDEMGVEIRLQHESIFNSMHKL